MLKLLFVAVVVAAVAYAVVIVHAVSYDVVVEFDVIVAALINIIHFLNSNFISQRESLNLRLSENIFRNLGLSSEYKKKKDLNLALRDF